MKKVKLLCCIHDFRGRGAERVLSALLDRFDRERYDLGVFVYHDNEAMKIPGDITLMSAHVKTPASLGIVTKASMFISKITALTKAINSYRPDVVLSVAGTNIGLMIAMKFCHGKPNIIMSEHTLPFTDLKRINNRLERYLTNKAIAATCRKAERMIVPAQGVSVHLSLHYHILPERIKVIPNPIDTGQIRNAAEKEAPFTFPADGSFRIGFVGGLTREKNVGCLLRAFAILKNKGVRARLFIVGEGVERAALTRLVNELSLAETVHFLGYHDNPYALLKNFNVLVVPSLYETFSYVIPEAFACGVPVVSSRWPYCEYLYRDNENCLLFPVNDHDQLSRSIEKLITDEELRIRLIKNGQELLDKCNADAVVRQYEAVIESVLPDGKQGRS